MITRITRITPLILSLFLFSCSTVQEDAVEPTEQTNDNSVLMDLANQSWILDDCPTSSTLNIDGFTECDYLGYMSFTEESVFIRHGNNSYFTEHNICSVNGSNMVVSRQGCNFTEWSGVVEIEVIKHSGGILEIDVRFPNLNTSYNERYIYEEA